MGFPSADNPKPAGSRHNPCECACPRTSTSIKRQAGCQFGSGLAGLPARSFRALSQFVHSQSRARKQADKRVGLRASARMVRSLAVAALIGFHAAPEGNRPQRLDRFYGLRIPLGHG